MPIDPVVVREKREMLNNSSRASEKGIKAADALLWGCLYVKDNPARDVLKINISVVASATQNADIVARYVKDSALSFAEDILDRAFEMAQRDFDAATRTVVQSEHKP